MKTDWKIRYRYQIVAFVELHWATNRVFKFLSKPMQTMDFFCTFVLLVPASRSNFMTFRGSALFLKTHTDSSYHHTNPSYRHKYPAYHNIFLVSYHILVAFIVSMAVIIVSITVYHRYWVAWQSYIYSLSLCKTLFIVIQARL